MVAKAGEASGNNEMVRFFFYWMYVFTLTGVAALMTSFLAPGVEGSGIPVSDRSALLLLGEESHSPCWAYYFLFRCFLVLHFFSLCLAFVRVTSPSVSIFAEGYTVTIESYITSG